MKKRNFIIIVSAFIISGGVYYYIFSNSHKKFEWKYAKVTRGNISVLVTATGSVNADTTVSVGTQVSGTVAKLYADWNTPVKQGRIIALIDTTFLSAARINAQATLDKAQVQVDQTQRDLNRYRKLLDEKVVAQSEYETYLTAHESAKALLTSAKAALNQSLVNLQYAVIKAPVSGVIISRNVELGQTVAASFNTPTLFTIANNLKKMQVLATVDEADIGQIKLGQKADFTVDAYPDTTFSGEISQIRLQPMMVQNVVNYIVVINVRNSDLKLLPGMTTNLKVKVKEHKNILKIPINALHFNPPDEYLSNTSDSLKKKWAFIFSKSSSNKVITNAEPNKYAYLWVKYGNGIFPKRLILGLTDGAYTEVSGEIKEGDEVVTGTNTSASSTTTNPFMPSIPNRRH